MGERGAGHSQRVSAHGCPESGGCRWETLSCLPSTPVPWLCVPCMHWAFPARQKGAGILWAPATCQRGFMPFLNTLLPPVLGKASRLASPCKGHACCPVCSRSAWPRVSVLSARVSALRGLQVKLRFCSLKPMAQRHLARCSVSQGGLSQRNTLFF